MPLWSLPFHLVVVVHVAATRWRPSDDVTRYFEGGRGGDYVYDIPADHIGGSYWYHAHHHGATKLHVGGGAYGMIVVDNPADAIPLNARCSILDREMCSLRAIGRPTFVLKLSKPTCV